MLHRMVWLSSMFYVILFLCIHFFVSDHKAMSNEQYVCTDLPYHETQLEERRSIST